MSPNVETAPFKINPISFHPSIERVVINIGTNTSPLKPQHFPQNVVIIAVEANVAIANLLRESYQKQYPNRFFVINSAVSDTSTGEILRPFHFYNSNGMSSSLSVSMNGKSWANRTRFAPISPFGPGQAGFDIVPVISLNTILEVIPSKLRIILLKTDTQGHDLSIIKSAERNQVRRIERMVTETHLSRGNFYYKNTKNDLVKDWIPHMKSVGFKLENNDDRRTGAEFDARWVRH